MANTGVGDHTYNVLFLCSRNAARSLMAEAILNRNGSSRFRAFSAGTHPSGAVHPLAIETLARLNYPTAGLRSKSWDEFSGPGAPAMDFVITVCDDAAGEECPVWPGHPMVAHWSIENPALAEGSDIRKEAAFNTCFRHLKNRISVFAALPIATLDRLALAAKLKEIGEMDDTPVPAAKAG